MSFFVWQTQYTVGEPAIDLQHRRLFELAEQLHAAMANGKGKQAEQGALSALIRYTADHFRHEEAWMAKVAYPARGTHKAMHEAFTKQVLQFQAKFEAGGVGLSIQMFQFVRDWLVNHICKEDAKIAAGALAGVR